MESEKEKTEKKPPEEQAQPQPTTEASPQSSEPTSNPSVLTQEKKDTSK